jgi:hypothetical protein
MTFHEGEEKLSQWMSENAFVTWLVHPEPWRLEDYAIKQLSLPLNLRDNEGHPFHRTRALNNEQCDFLVACTRAQ